MGDLVKVAAQLDSIFDLALHPLTDSLHLMVQHRLENGTVAEMLPRHAEYEGLTPELVDEIRRNGRGSYKYAKSMQDFRLIQLTWGCDLNFAVSAVTLKSEDIFEKIAADLRPWHIDDLLDTLLTRIDAIG